MEVDWSEVQRLLGVHFNDQTLLETAFTHSSVRKRAGYGSRTDNVRLELLGNSALGLIVSEYMFRRFPQDDERLLTNRSQALLAKSALADRTKYLRIDQFLLTDRTLYGLPPEESPTIQAGLMKAVVGAIYLDQGDKAAKDFVTRVIIESQSGLWQDET